MSFTYNPSDEHETVPSGVEAQQDNCKTDYRFVTELLNTYRNDYLKAIG